MTDPVRHYVEIGWQAGFDPHPLFLTQYYCEQWGDSAGRDPLSHYITAGWRMGLRANPLFDSHHYLHGSPDVANAGTDPLIHYSTQGWREGRSPHPLFDIGYYASQMRGDSEPLGHYLRIGHGLGLDPHPLFSTDYYLAQAPDVAASSANALAHFSSFGGEELRQHHPLFDPRWYKEQTACSGIPVLHYLSSNGRFDPSPMFGTRYYLEHSETARRSAEAPLVHWVVEDAPNGRSFSSLPLDEVVLEMLLRGDVVGATAMMRQRHQSRSAAGRVVLPFRMGSATEDVGRGWMVGGLPGVISSEAVLVGCAAVDRPRVLSKGGSVVLTRSSGGIASADRMAETVAGAYVVENGLDSDRWLWYLRCLPALRSAVGEGQARNIVVTTPLDETAAAVTRFVLDGCRVIAVEPGEAIEATNVAIVAQEHPSASEPVDERTGLVLVLDRNDPITTSDRASLISAVVEAGGRVLDTCWGPPAIAECIAECSRLIGFESLPVLAYFASPGSSLVALDDSLPDHARRDIAAKGLKLEVVRLPVADLPADQHHQIRLDPTAKLAEIVGRPP
jgi:hypothetical protein